MRVTADATKSLEKATDTAMCLAQRLLGPPADALAKLGTDIVDVLRGPFSLLRLHTLEAIARKAAELREAQNVTNPIPLPPKSTHIVIEQASFVEDEKMRDLWARLIVNAQAGMEISAYIFEVLSKLDGADVALIRQAADSEGRIGPMEGSFSRLVALGLMIEDTELSVMGPPQALNTEGRLEFVGYLLTDLADDLLEAVGEPRARNLYPSKFNSVQVVAAATPRNPTRVSSLSSSRTASGSRCFGPICRPEPRRPAARYPNRISPLSGRGLRSFRTLKWTHTDPSYARHLLPRLAKRAGVDRRIHRPPARATTHARGRPGTCRRARPRDPAATACAGGS